MASGTTMLSRRRSQKGRFNANADRRELVMTLTMWLDGLVDGCTSL